jgi:twitching motility two-component system response regulator PilH
MSALPQAIAAAPRHPLQPDSPALSGERRPQVSNKILLVDDSPTELAVLSSLLESEGFEVVTARDGEDALEKLGRERPRMVLLDVVMPGKNGFSLCRQIRNHSEFGQTPVILVTSKSQASDRFWGLKQGAVDYVTKPWSASELLATVRRHL